MPAINFIALPVATATAGRRAGRAFSFIRPSGRVYGGHGSGDNTRYHGDVLRDGAGLVGDNDRSTPSEAT
jgi:hypothetical protein